MCRLSLGIGIEKKEIERIQFRRQPKPNPNPNQRRSGWDRALTTATVREVNPGPSARQRSAALWARAKWHRRKAARRRRALPRASVRVGKGAYGGAGRPPLRPPRAAAAATPSLGGRCRRCCDEKEKGKVACAAAT